MRNMSFSMTTEAVRNRTKTVTRRLGWAFLKPGDLLMACEKCQGLKKGEKVKRLGVIRVVSVEKETLHDLFHYDLTATQYEMEREGFDGWTPWGFVDMFITANHCSEHTPLNRIEFEYVDGED